MDLNVSAKTMNLSEENIGVNLHGLEWGSFLDMKTKT